MEEVTRVSCEYCGSNIELAEGMNTCPLCGAPLGSAIEKAETVLEEKQQAEKEAEAALRKEEQQEKTKQTFAAAAASVVGSIAGSLWGRNTYHQGPGMDHPGGMPGPSHQRDDMGPSGGPGHSHGGQGGPGPRGGSSGHSGPGPR